MTPTAECSTYSKLSVFPFEAEVGGAHLKLDKCFSFLSATLCCVVSCGTSHMLLSKAKAPMSFFKTDYTLSILSLT